MIIQFKILKYKNGYLNLKQNFQILCLKLSRTSELQALKPRKGPCKYGKHGGTTPLCVFTAHKAGSACELYRDLLTWTGRVLHSLSQCMPCSDNGHSCPSLHISYCPPTLHIARSSCILCSQARLLSKLPGSRTACQHCSGGYPQRWQWS